eukprot:CAMPEP_0171774436 /NCGR_PEP_ID=MMETSP0991-20121206/55884_1 /TAXON_ID=483369 /ORGANISM="non described non described, Strain CCMP2098" /LENGTH=324 /DNA_ID=CAMNT_0012380357 /DNA_START=101 /DNA_END=1072 /DNA_ORIENTATION=+
MRSAASFARLGDLSTPALCGELRLRGIAALVEEDEEVLKTRLRLAVSTGSSFDNRGVSILKEDDVTVRLLSCDLGLLASRGVTVLPRQIYPQHLPAGGQPNTDDGLERYLSTVKEPFLLASSSKLNPARGWREAIEVWNDPREDVFVREFSAVPVGLRDVNEVARGGGLSPATRAQLENPFWSGSDSDQPFGGVATMGDLASDRARWLLGFGGVNRHRNPRAGGSVVFSTQRDALYEAVRPHLPLAEHHDHNGDNASGGDGGGGGDHAHAAAADSNGRQALQRYSMHPVVSVGTGTTPPGSPCSAAESCGASSRPTGRPLRGGR